MRAIGVAAFLALAVFGSQAGPRQIPVATDQELVLSAGPCI